MRSQLRLAYLRLTANFECNNIVYNNFEDIDLRYRKMYFPDSKDDEQILSVTSAEFHGLQYSLNMIFVVEINENDYLLFGKITDIFVKEKKLFFRMEPLKTLYFDVHYYA